MSGQFNGRPSRIVITNDTGAALAGAVACSMRTLRERHRSVAAFASVLAQELGRDGLSRQAIYDWEQGRSRVPAVVWIAAATSCGMTTDEALRDGWLRAVPGGRLADPGSQPRAPSVGKPT